MKTLKELSHDTFYKMGNYSQLVIDLVQEVEELYIYEEGIISFKAMQYTVDNILKVIAKNRTYDVQALETLSSILNQEIERRRTVEVI